MSADVCMEHGQPDEEGNPCLKCVIESIHEWTGSRDGSPETDEQNLQEIREICEKAMPELVEEELAEDEEDEGDDEDDPE